MAAEESAPRTALVLCGGGSRGAVEAGLYLALEELRVGIDLVVGSSIGALNGALIASGMPARELAGYWRQLRRSDLAVVSWASLFQGLAADGLLSARAFRRHLDRVLPVRTFEELRIALVVVATDLMSGAAVELRAGSLSDAVLASCAVPGLFPPVPWNGRQLIDGGVAKNLPVDVALREGTERVIGILCRCCPELEAPARGLVRILGQSFSIAVDVAQRAQLRPYERDPRVWILAPEIAPEIGTLDFRGSDVLIEAAYAHSRRRLSELLAADGTPGHGRLPASELRAAPAAQRSGAPGRGGEG